MEIELKYNIPDEETAEAIWNNEFFADAEEPDSRVEIILNARYYDTREGDLAKNEIAYRVRKENDRYIATLKCGGSSEGGLHVREEINVPVISADANPEVFDECSIGDALLDIIQDKELVCFIETNITRRCIRIDTGEGIFEISIDKGEVVTEYGQVPISEVEIELYSGEKEELLEIGKVFQEKYGLKPENVSKYAKGIELIKRHK